MSAYGVSAFDASAYDVSPYGVLAYDVLTHGVFRTDDKSASILILVTNSLLLVKTIFQR